MKPDVKRSADRSIHWSLTAGKQVMTHTLHVARRTLEPAQPVGKLKCPRQPAFDRTGFKDAGAYVASSSCQGVGALCEGCGPVGRRFAIEPRVDQVKHLNRRFTYLVHHCILKVQFGGRRFLQTTEPPQ